jgi:hypothetical protein
MSAALRQTARSEGEQAWVRANLQRLTAGVAVGILVGVTCFLLRGTAISMGHWPGGDFSWALFAARDVLARRDPYSIASSALRVPYPLPVIVFGLPLMWLPDRLAASVFVGVSCAVIAYQRHESPWWLLALLSIPGVTAIGLVQWSPLIAAAWYIPVLAPLLVLIKPQAALPIALNRLGWRGIGVATAVLVATLAIYPAWPLRWLGTISEYEYVIPVLQPYGWLLLAGLPLCVHSRLSRVLMMSTMLPLRGPYDAFALVVLIPQNRLQMTVLVALSYFLDTPALHIAMLGIVAIEALWPSRPDNGALLSERPSRGGQMLLERV